VGDRSVTAAAAATVDSSSAVAGSPEAVQSRLAGALNNDSAVDAVGDMMLHRPALLCCGDVERIAAVQMNARTQNPLGLPRDERTSNSLQGERDRFLGLP
jgi:hypothetical protein